MQTRGNALYSQAYVHLYSLCQTRLTLKTHTVSEIENRTSCLTTLVRQSQSVAVSHEGGGGSPSEGPPQPQFQCHLQFFFGAFGAQCFLCFLGQVTVPPIGGGGGIAKWGGGGLPCVELGATRPPRRGGGVQLPHCCEYLEGAEWRLCWCPWVPFEEISGGVQPPLPPFDIPSGHCSFTGPWTVTRPPLRMLRRVAAFCRPLRPVLLLVSFPRSRSPVVGVTGLC